MNDQNTPTEEGKRRYPPNGFSYASIACACEPSCKKPCRGECGCPACSDIYLEYLDIEARIDSEENGKQP
jgi:hypothetical protein